MSRKRFLLLIDDDPSLRELIQAALAYEGYPVRTASDGPSGLALASEDTGVVLLDITVPGLDTQDFARRLRKAGGTEAPIVVFTASRRALQVARAIDAAGVLKKPFELDDLIALAKTHLDDDDSTVDERSA